MWKEILNNLISVSALSLVIIFLGKNVITHFFSKDLEKFKSDLEKESFSHRVRYEKMHSERAETIKELYKKIVRTHRIFSSYMNPFQGASEPSQQEKGKQAAEFANDFSNFYEENRIFLDENLAKETDKLSKTFKEAWIEFELSRFNKENHVSYLQNWNKAWKIISVETPLIKRRIEIEFRKIIGIENGKE